MSYTQRLTDEHNNKTLAECLKPTRMTTIVWQLLKTSKYLYDNKSLYNLLTKVNPIFSRLFSCFLIFSRDFAYVSHAGRESSRYCGSLLKFRMIELLPTPEVEEGFVKRDEVLETTRKKVGQHGRVGADCGLHPLIHTFPTKSSAPDVGKKKSGAKNSAFSKFAPKYCSGVSRAKVWYVIHTPGRLIEMSWEYRYYC